MEALNIALQIENVSNKIDTFYIHLLLLSFPEGCWFPGFSIHAVRVFVWRWAVCGKLFNVWFQGRKMGKNLFEENIVWWKKTWCCSEFRFQLYQLFPFSWFVTLGIHTWIVDIHSDSLYHKQSNDLGWNFQLGTESWQFHGIQVSEVKSPTSQLVQVEMVGQVNPQHGRKQVWK